MISRRKFVKSAAGVLIPATFGIYVPNRQIFAASAIPIPTVRNSASGSAPPTYLIKQGFETATTGYDNGESWTTSGATITPTYATAPAPLDGTQSCRLNGTTARLTSPTFAGQNDAWVYFLINIAVQPASTTTFMTFPTVSNLGLDRLSDGTVRMSGTVNSTPTVGVMSLNTTYQVRIRYTKGTGANAFYSVEFTTTVGSFSGSGNNYTQATTGSETAQSTNIRFHAEAGTTVDHIIDKIRVDDVIIGSNPT